MKLSNRGFDIGRLVRTLDVGTGRICVSCGSQKFFPRRKASPGIQSVEEEKEEKRKDTQEINFKRVSNKIFEIKDVIEDGTIAGNNDKK